MWFSHCIATENKIALPNEQTIEWLKNKNERKRHCHSMATKKQEKKYSSIEKNRFRDGSYVSITCKSNIDWGFCFIDIMDFIRKQSAPFKIKWFSFSLSLVLSFSIELFPLLFISFSLLLVLSSVLWLFVLPYSEAF